MTLTSGCHRWILREQPLAVVHAVKKEGVTKKQTVSGYISSLPVSCPLSVCKVCPCVIIRLDTRIFTEEMKVFLLLITSAF